MQQRQTLASWTCEARRVAPLQYEWRRLSSVGRDSLIDAMSGVDVAALAERRRRADRLTFAVVLEVLQRCGVFDLLPCPAARFDRAAEECRLSAELRKLLRRWLADVECSGVIRRSKEDAHWDLNRGRLEQFSIGALGDSVAFYADMVESIVQVLQGKIHILELVAGAARPQWLSRYVAEYLRSDTDGLCNQAVAEIVCELGKVVPAGRPLRILELGAGTGRLTRAVLDALRRHSSLTVEYAFTDISTFFLRRAREQFDGHRMLFDRFDINSEPAAVGFAAATFDVVLAFEVLHCARDLERTMRNLRYLLQPGGLLMVAELCQNRWSHLVLPAMVPGFMDLEDDRLDGYMTLLPPAEWRRRAARAGYGSFFVVPADDESHVDAQALGEAVLVASSVQHEA